MSPRAQPDRAPRAPRGSPAPAGPELEQRVAGVGRELLAAVLAVLEALPEAGQGPQRLAQALGLDKVLASRLLKAARSRDPMAVAYHMPGPDPLRRFFRAARKRGVPAELTRAGELAVDAFDGLIRRDAGDRSALDAILSAWLPEARQVFELRRKQAAYRAMSQLKGATAATTLACVLLHPASDGERLDVVWLTGLLGLTRLRPDARVKLSTRRLASSPESRHPTTLSGDVVRDLDTLDGLRLDAFCHAPPAPLEVRRGEQTVHYLLGPSGYGPQSAVDLLLAEVNMAEMPRFVPRGSGRKGYVFAEVATPCRTLLFDVFVHADVYPNSEPELRLYDTAFEGIADVNDPACDLDRLDLHETIQPLGRGTAHVRTPELPDQAALLEHVFEQLGWDRAAFRGHRCRIDYPLYGSQVVMAFDPPERAG